MLSIPKTFSRWSMKVQMTWPCRRCSEWTKNNRAFVCLFVCFVFFKERFGIILWILLCDQLRTSSFAIPSGHELHLQMFPNIANSLLRTYLKSSHFSLVLFLLLFLLTCYLNILFTFLNIYKIALTTILYHKPSVYQALTKAEQTCIHSFNLHNNLWKKTLQLCPVYRWGNEGTERISNFPKVKSLHSKSGFKTRSWA